MDEQFRTVEVYKSYFADFMSELSRPIKKKIYWTLNLIETIPRVSEKFLKKLEGTDGLYEIRVEFGGDMFRIFCLFDEGKLVILLNGFSKKTRKTPIKEIERALRLRDNTMKRNPNLTPLSELIDKEFGERGNPEREEYEHGFEEFKLGFMIQEARKKQGMTQQELADKCGTNKAYISRVENDIKDVRLSTLRKIIESGLGGELELAIKF